MKVVGIVAEYNPFHNGHKYQLDYAKNVLKADYIVVAMSGSFTQRGSIACYDKYTRANAALINGADLVLEIPTIFATSSAREFASAGVQLLAATGIVDTILFGAETDDIEGFINNTKKLAEIEETLAFNIYVNQKVTSGLSYAQARANYLKKYIDIDFISSSNNILGTEYVKYIYENNLNLTPVCMKRAGNNYNDNELSGQLSSASSIRKALVDKTDISMQIPENVFPLYSKAVSIDQDDISLLLHYKLICQNDFSNYLDSNNDISDRIIKMRNDYISFTEFADKLKAKNTSYSRISRILCHILLGITTDDFEKEKQAGYIKYLRLLGFSQNGSKLLKLIKQNGSKELITSPASSENEFDVVSSDIVRLVLTSKTNTTYPNEFTRKFELKNI